MRHVRSERGAALIEVAMTLPLVLLVSVGIFEFGRAYQTWQVLTNAAREGARVAVLPGSTTDGVQTVVQTYLDNGGIANAGSASTDVVQVTIDGRPHSQITVSFPFEFMVLGPVMQLVTPGATGGDDFTMQARSVMRDES